MGSDSTSFATGDNTSVHVADKASESVEGEVNPPMFKLKPESHRCSFTLEPSPDQGRDNTVEAEDEGVVVLGEVREVGEGEKDRVETKGLDSDDSENEAPWRRRARCCGGDSEDCCCWCC